MAIFFFLIFSISINFHFSFHNIYKYNFLFSFFGLILSVADYDSWVCQGHLLFSILFPESNFVNLDSVDYCISYLILLSIPVFPLINPLSMIQIEWSVHFTLMHTICSGFLIHRQTLPHALYGCPLSLVPSTLMLYISPHSNGMLFSFMNAINTFSLLWLFMPSSW